VTDDPDYETRIEHFSMAPARWWRRRWRAFRDLLACLFYMAFGPRDFIDD
jgi:hypothetical protein